MKDKFKLIFSKKLIHIMSILVCIGIVSMPIDVFACCGGEVDMTGVPIDVTKHHKADEDFTNFPLNDEGSAKATWHYNEQSIEVTGYGDIEKDKWDKVKTMLSSKNEKKSFFSGTVNYGFYESADINIIFLPTEGKTFSLPEDCSYFFAGIGAPQGYFGRIELNDDLDTSKVKNMEKMFFQVSKAKPNVKNWDVSNVTNMKDMFNSYKSTFSPEVGNWDVSSVTDMTNMFYSAISIKTIDVSNWDVSNVTNMNQMFNKAYKLESIDLSNWDNKDANTYHIFEATNDLKEIVLGENTVLTNPFLPDAASEIPQNRRGNYTGKWVEELSDTVYDELRFVELSKGKYIWQEAKNIYVPKDGEVLPEGFVKVTFSKADGIESISCCKEDEEHSLVYYVKKGLELPKDKLPKVIVKEGCDNIKWTPIVYNTILTEDTNFVVSATPDIYEASEEDKLNEDIIKSEKEKLLDIYIKVSFDSGDGVATMSNADKVYYVKKGLAFPVEKLPEVLLDEKYKYEKWAPNVDTLLYNDTVFTVTGTNDEGQKTDRNVKQENNSNISNSGRKNGVYTSGSC